MCSTPGAGCPRAAAGWRCDAYHAGRGREDRERVQNHFLDRELDVVVLRQQPQRLLRDMLAERDEGAVRTNFTRFTAAAGLDCWFAS